MLFLSYRAPYFFTRDALDLKNCLLRLIKDLFSIAYANDGNITTLRRNRHRTKYDVDILAPRQYWCLGAVILPNRYFPQNHSNSFHYFIPSTDIAFTWTSITLISFQAPPALYCKGSVAGNILWAQPGLIF